MRQIHPQAFDLVILIEGGSEERTGQKHLHHYFSHQHRPPRHQQRATADINWVVPEAAAVGELIYELGLELAVEFEPRHRLQPVRGDRLRHRLVQVFQYHPQGAGHRRPTWPCAAAFAPFDVSNLLFNSNPPEKIRMLTRVLSTLELALDERVAMIDFQRAFLEPLNLKDIETEDIIAIARSIDGVQVLLFFKEIDDDYLPHLHPVPRRFFRPPGRPGFSTAAGTTMRPVSFISGDLAAAKKEILRAGRGHSSNDPWPGRRQQGKGASVPTP